MVGAIGRGSRHSVHQTTYCSSSVMEVCRCVALEGLTPLPMYSTVPEFEDERMADGGCEAAALEAWLNGGVEQNRGGCSYLLHLLWLQQRNADLEVKKRFGDSKHTRSKGPQVERGKGSKLQPHTSRRGVLDVLFRDPHQISNSILHHDRSHPKPSHQQINS